MDRSGLTARPDRLGRCAMSALLWCAVIGCGDQRRSQAGTADAPSKPLDTKPLPAQVAAQQAPTTAPEPTASLEEASSDEHEVRLTGAWKVERRWGRRWSNVSAPTFGPDGRTLAFTVKRHWPDGHGAHGSKRIGVLRGLRVGNPRVADPVVVVLGQDADEPRAVDWGWTPAFSRDGKRLTYARQTYPISGKRALASTLAGNAIWIANLVDGGTREILRSEGVPVQCAPEGWRGPFDVASVKCQSFVAPQFSDDGSELLVELLAPVNGAYAGTIGVVRVDAESGASIVIREFVIGSYDGVAQAHFSGDAVVLLRKLINAESEYVPELVRIGSKVDVLHRWDKSENPAALHVDARGRVLFLDGHWRDVATRKPVRGFARVAPDMVGPVSRDGRHAMQFVERFARPGGTQTVSLVDAYGRLRGKAVFGDGVVQNATFADDGKRAAITVTHHFMTDDQHDVLYVLALR